MNLTYRFEVYLEKNDVHIDTVFHTFYSKMLKRDMELSVKKSLEDHDGYPPVNVERTGMLRDAL